MSWRELFGRPRSGRGRSVQTVGESQAAVEWTSPGLASLFGALGRGRSRSVLDLAHASDSHLRVLGRMAGQVRFAGLVPFPPRGEALDESLSALPPSRDEPYELVLAWDVFDRLAPDERARLMRRLVELTAPDAWMHALVDATGAPEARPLRLRLLETDRVSQEPVAPPEPMAPQLLPARFERLIAPFEIVHAFSLRAGRREYVTRRPERVAPGTSVRE